MRQAESFLPPAGVLAGDKRPWETFDWPAERRRGIYRSWGQYFRNARMNTAAQKYFDKCIDEDGNGGLSKGDDYLALYLRSKFNRSVARTQEAYEDSQHAARVAGPNDAGINTELADTVYDLNRFEDNKRMLHDFVRKYVGTSVKPLEHRLRIVNENFDDCMGDDSLGTFLMENSAQLGGCFEQISREKSPPDLRPRWKILKELNECDVQSVCDKEEKLLSPLEMARRKRKTKIFYQNYLNRAWTDIFFLKTLRQNPNLLLDRYFGSPTKRGEYLNRSFERVKKFTKMLHSRSPMYNELHQRRGNPRMKSQLHESSLYRVQYQTRRNMHSILRTIRVLRQQEDSKRLRRFVEEVMGDYVAIKTTRIMPWKIEFMNEVYNHLALSLCEEFRLPPTKVTPYDKNAMCLLLNIPIVKPLDHQEFVFGDRSTYAYSDGVYTAEQKVSTKRSINHLERRLVFATLPIERTYLLHELADRHVQQNHFVQCLSYAQKAIEEAEHCNSKIWQFLSTMQMAKSHAILHKYERQTEVLDAAYDLAKELKSPKLCTFIELCRMLNKDYITLRKMSQLVASKRLRYKMSNRSSGLSSSQHSSPSNASIVVQNIMA
ncbi:uncharacterized protein LOC6641292 [Drosophila willistoni]|uniref:uncharacterized protein LOC6641292 n=1 Tax=Drosophila willistoni TaxID=7260 RepID=UPI001F079BA0|nr:uncharacterized protein LOC6641292 [Drosophila willistoni]